MPYISRETYMDWLRRWRDKEPIKVVSGVRRCGKSTLLQMFRDELKTEGIPEENLISINFEDISYEHLTEYRSFHDYILECRAEKGTTYLFLDEIQNVEHFEKALDSLSIQREFDIYVTGSNARLLSSELGTLLTGRYVELQMLPLSYREFGDALIWRGKKTRSEQGIQAPSSADLFSLYLEVGSFPYVTELLDDPKTVREYIQGIYSSILLKDIVQRLHISDSSLLERVAKVLASSTGSLVSINKIANTLNSLGRKCDQKTADKYIDGLVSSMLFYEVPRWDVKGRQLLARNSKYYIVDAGLRRNLVAGSSKDLGHLLENTIYLELRRRYEKVYVGIVEGGEVDFVALDEDGISYFQVSASVMDSSVLERELASLQKIADHNPKMLITLDTFIPTKNIDGIKIVNAIEWLLSFNE